MRKITEGEGKWIKEREKDDRGALFVGHIYNPEYVGGITPGEIRHVFVPRDQLLKATWKIIGNRMSRLWEDEEPPA